MTTPTVDFIVVGPHVLADNDPLDGGLSRDGGVWTAWMCLRCGCRHEASGAGKPPRLVPFACDEHQVEGEMLYTRVFFIGDADMRGVWAPRPSPPTVSAR